MMRECDRCGMKISHGTLCHDCDIYVTSYCKGERDGRRLGRADAERDFQNSDYWNDYLAKVIADNRAKVIDEFADKIKEHSSFHYVDCDGYGGLEELIFKVEDWLDEIIETMRSEVERWQDKD